MYNWNAKHPVMEGHEFTAKQCGAGQRLSAAIRLRVCGLDCKAFSPFLSLLSENDHISNIIIGTPLTYHASQDLNVSNTNDLRGPITEDYPNPQQAPFDRVTPLLQAFQQNERTEQGREGKGENPIHLVVNYGHISRVHEERVVEKEKKRNPSKNPPAKSLPLIAFRLNLAKTAGHVFLKGLRGRNGNGLIVRASLVTQCSRMKSTKWKDQKERKGKGPYSFGITNVSSGHDRDTSDLRRPHTAAAMAVGGMLSPRFRLPSWTTILGAEKKHKKFPCQAKLC
ncbi:hypothetical protein NPIL_209801 [Nephila pilipes]|uniref:Uncharacterized protein n=1 Tax=Nephila pilipes TaxID=299642 RepID=A0A8X6PE82_NEPPI|nr:hypothetical protein NPIL_209801 [Nephila pilipes]